MKLGRPRQYLRLDAWNAFLSNDFWHLKQRVKLIFIGVGFILAFNALTLGLVALSLIK